MFYAKVLSLIILIQSCSLNFESTENDRLYLKELSDERINVEWFYYSLIGNTTPDYIIVSNEFEIDTICIASNIADIELRNDSVFLDFYGVPRKYMKPITLPSESLGYLVVVDTNSISPGPVYRETYTKEQ